jgi:hypothetical protein
LNRTDGRNPACREAVFFSKNFTGSPASLHSRDMFTECVLPISFCLLLFYCICYCFATSFEQWSHEPRPPPPWHGVFPAARSDPLELIQDAIADFQVLVIYLRALCILFILYKTHSAMVVCSSNHVSSVDAPLPRTPCKFFLALQRRHASKSRRHLRLM